MKLLRNVNPMGYIDLPVIGRQGATDDEDGQAPGSGCLVPGEIFRCPDAVAGEAPFWRPVSKDDEHDEHGVPKLEYRNGDDGLEVHDLGHGLLAQVDNYQLIELEGLRVEGLLDLAKALRVDVGETKKRADILALIEKG